MGGSLLKVSDQIYRLWSQDAAGLILKRQSVHVEKGGRIVGRYKMLGFDPQSGSKEALENSIMLFQCLNIHADESATSEALGYSLCFCKKKHTIVPLQLNINTSY